MHTPPAPHSPTLGDTPPPTAQFAQRMRGLDPLIKAATEASVLADHAWLFLARAAAEGAAAGGTDAKKLLENAHADAAKDARKGALLLLQQARKLFSRQFTVV